MGNKGKQSINLKGMRTEGKTLEEWEEKEINRNMERKETERD